VGAVGGASRTGNDGRWWEGVGAVGTVGAVGAVGAVGDSPRTPEGGQAASGGTSNW